METFLGILIIMIDLILIRSFYLDQSPCTYNVDKPFFCINVLSVITLMFFFIFGCTLIFFKG